MIVIRNLARRGFGSWPGVGRGTLESTFACGLKRAGGAGGEGKRHDEVIVEVEQATQPGEVDREHW